MNREKQNNRPLILSIITLMICIALLIGATMAWFTDTETNTGNKIQAGTLDAKLYKYTGKGEPTTTDLDSNWTQITDDTASDFIFDFDPEEGWQPGDSETIYLAVENAGSLKFDYNIDLIVEDDALADALQVSITYDQNKLPTATTTAYQTISSLIDVDENGDALKEKTGNIYLAQTGLLAATYIDYIKVEIKLDESSGASYPGDAFEMDLILTATQADQDDTIVKAYDIEDITRLTTEDADKTVILMKDIKSDTAVTIPTNVNIDLNGYTLTVKSFSMTNETDYCTVDIANGTIVATDGTGDGTGVSVIIPKGTVNVENGTIASNGQIIFNASSSTLNLTGTTQFVTLSEENEPTSTEKSITILADTRVVVDTTADTTLIVSNNVTVEDGRSDTTEDVQNATITVEIPANTTNVVINNSSETTSSIEITGEGASGVTMQEDGVVQLSASDQFIADLKSAKTGDTVTLTGHVTIEANLYIYGKAICIDMNGYDFTVKGALVLDYSDVSKLTSNDWVIIGAGEFVSYSKGTVTLSKEQKGVLTLNALYVGIGSGNFVATSATGGSSSYTAYYDYDDGYFVAGGEMTWSDFTMYESLSVFETKIADQGLSASTTITIGTSTND